MTDARPTSFGGPATLGGTARVCFHPRPMIPGSSPPPGPLARLLSQAYLAVVLVSALGLMAGLVWALVTSLGA
jgi:hypothetical protein